MKTIGLIGGLTWLSTIDYYRLLNEMVSQRLGGLHSSKVLIYSVDFAEVSALQEENKWDELTTMFVRIAKSLEIGGAECLMIGANTMHKIADEIQAAIAIPVIHIGEATAMEVKKHGLRRAGLLGTRYVMELDFYRGKLASQGIDSIVPLDDEREFIHSSIYHELARGIFKKETKQRFMTIINSLVERGAEGVILGCTEIPILIKQTDVSVPVFDTTGIHVRAAIGYAMD